VAEAGCVSSADRQSPVDASTSFSSDQHHNIADNRRNPVNIFTFVRDNHDDPAVKVEVLLKCVHFLHVAHNFHQHFIPKLKDHILFRLRKLDISYCDHTFTNEERNTVIIPNHTIYSLQTMQVHYITYDLRHEYDTVNPRTHADVMVLSGETKPTHPYWYARVLGIYQVEAWLANANVRQPVKQHLDILWVRWLAPPQNYQSGLNQARLPKVAFVEESDSDAFGFLDPSQVIRGAHLIPAFASERGTSALRYGKSLARPGEELDDWEEHYVGM
jgi:hypothetical protein